jgi:hypothetical protein
MANGRAPARRAGLFFTAIGMGSMRAQAWDFFDAAVRWLTAREVLLVVGDITLSWGDEALVARLETLGFAAVVVADSILSPGDADGMDLVVISESVPSASVAGAILAPARVPLLCLEPSQLAGLGMTGTSSGTDFGSVAGATQVQIVAPAHPLAAGLSGAPTVLSAAASLGWGKPAGTAAKVATVIGDSGKATVFGYEAGAVMASARARGRRVGWFASVAAVAGLSPDGWRMFDAAVRWATRPVAVVFNGRIPANSADQAVIDSLERLGYGVWKLGTGDFLDAYF